MLGDRLTSATGYVTSGVYKALNCMEKSSFLFLATYFPGGYALAEALAERHATYTIAFYDWLNYCRIRPNTSCLRVNQYWKWKKLVIAV